MSRNKRRETVKTAVWRVLLLSVVFVAMWQLPAFAEEAEEAVEYTPALFATAWALLPPTGSDQFGADHQRGLQFFVYRNRGRWYPVFRWKI